jgi:DNA-binding PadR family transcriptional regulator
MKKDSQRRMYSLNKEGIDEMQDWISEIKNLWVKRLDRMNKYVMKLKKERASNNA